MEDYNEQEKKEMLEKFFEEVNDIGSYSITVDSSVEAVDDACGQMFSTQDYSYDLDEKRANKMIKNVFSWNARKVMELIDEREISKEMVKSSFEAFKLSKSMTEEVQTKTRVKI